jgi:CheY-like chemotaxis protein
MSVRTKILAVDDEEFNLDIIGRHLAKAGFDVILAGDGQEALERLEEYPGIAAIVLDRMMPVMDGMEFLHRIKETQRYRDIPVIMQTAAAGSAQVLQGIQAGVYYYLTKPYDDVLLLAILESALKDARSKKEMKEQVSRQRRMLGLMEESIFRFRTLEEAKTLAFYIANCFPEPEKTVFGLNELMVNAVEHGNLGIAYAEKTRLVMDGAWMQEIERRLQAAEHRNQFARLTYKAMKDRIVITIKDQGAGFDWANYVELAPSRATDPNGRGIAASRLMSFDSIEYLGCGNEVLCTVYLKQPETTAGDQSPDLWNTMASRPTTTAANTAAAAEM